MNLLVLSPAPHHHNPCHERVSDPHTGHLPGYKEHGKRVIYTCIRDIPTNQKIRLWWPYGVYDCTLEALHTSQQMKISKQSIRLPFTLYQCDYKACIGQVCSHKISCHKDSYGFLPTFKTGIKNKDQILLLVISWNIQTLPL